MLDVKFRIFACKLSAFCRKKNIEIIVTFSLIDWKFIADSVDMLL